MPNDKWKDEGICNGDDVNLFFDTYEQDVEVRKEIDSLCSICPMARTCFAVGVSQKAYGVWGGIYLDKGRVSREFNNHKTKQDWGKTWEHLTTDKEY